MCQPPVAARGESGDDDAGERGDDAGKKHQAMRATELMLR